MLISFSDFLFKKTENGLNQISIYEKHKIVFSSDFYLMYCDLTKTDIFSK